MRKCRKNRNIPIEKEPPYIKGEAQILDESGNIIGYETVVYLNPKYDPYEWWGQTEGQSNK